jgi:chromosome partitioning protein
VRTLGIIAQKGGTGKTTLSVHLAVQALLEGKRVLLVDMDPQASATSWWERRQAEQPQLIQGGGEALPNLLKRAREQAFDLVIADTAPHSSADANTCARLSDHILIPTRPAILDLAAIGATTSIVSEAGSRAVIVLNACPPPSRYGEPHIVREAREALRVYGLPVCQVAVSQRAAFSHALIDGRAVAEFDAVGKAATEIDDLWQTVKRDIDL